MSNNPSLKFIVVPSTGGGNGFSNVYVSGTDSGYNWTVAGNIGFKSNATSNVIKFIAGSGTELDIDVGNDAIRITSVGSNTANIAYNEANAAYNIAQAAFAQANAGATKAFANVFVTNTDIGFNYTVAGNSALLATNTSNTLRIVSGPGTNIDADTGNNTIRVRLSNTGISSGNANWVNLDVQGRTIVSSVKPVAIHLALINPIAGTFYLIGASARQGTIAFANTWVDTGTLTANVVINNLPVSNLSALAVSNVPFANNATGANTVYTGNSIAVILNAVSGSPTQFNLTLNIIPG